jgi:hypothetical protein
MMGCMACEQYEARTRSIVDYFVAGRIDFVDCVQGLDAALNHAVKALTTEELPRLQAAMMANQERILSAIERQRPRSAITISGQNPIPACGVRPLNADAGNSGTALSE